MFFPTMGIPKLFITIWNILIDFLAQLDQFVANVDNVAKKHVRPGSSSKVSLKNEKNVITRKSEYYDSKGS